MTNHELTRPEFGQRCRVSAIAIKEYEFKSKIETYTRWNKHPLSPHRDGLYIGYRTVHEGITEDVKEYGTLVQRKFTHESSREVWLIVLSERENPVRAFPEDVEILL